MSDPLLGHGTSQFIFDQGPSGFLILPAFTIPLSSIKLYTSADVFIEDGTDGVTYPPVLNSGSPLIFSGLTPGLNYRFQAIAINEVRSFVYEINPQENLISLITLDPPSTPNLIVADTDVGQFTSSITSTTCPISWNEGNNIPGDVNITYYVALASSPQTKITNLISKPQTITGLIPDTPYGFVVVAQKSVYGQIAVSSDTLSIITSPFPVTNVRVSEDKTLLLWTDSRNRLPVEWKVHIYNSDGSDTSIIIGGGQEYSLPNVLYFDLRTLISEGLLANKLYLISVYTRNSTETGYLSSEVQLTNPFLTFPTSASDVLASDITSSGASVSWSTQQETGVTYSFQLLDSSDTLISDLGSQTSPYTLTGLTENTLYKINILATNATGSLTSSTSFTTAPNPASISSVDTITSSGCNLNLANFTPETLTYSILSTDSTGTTIQSTIQTPTSTPTTITGLTSNTLYYLIIQTNNNAGQYNSLPVSFTTLASASISSVDTITQTGCKVNTSDPESGVTYELIASVNSDGSDPVTSIAATSSSQALSGLSANTSYYLFIRATNTSGTTTSSSYPLLTSPNTPTGLGVSNLGTTSCDVTWSAGDSDVSFNIIQLSNDDGTTVINALAYNVTSPYSLSGLTSNSLYTIAIQSTNASGSVQSSTVPFTTLSLKSISAIFSHAAKAINTNVDVTITLKNDDGSTNTSEDASTITVSDGTNNFTVTYSEANGYVCVLNSETVGAVTYTISHAVFGTTSGSITWNSGGGGGGSGGGGENNTGNEHNNMSTGPISGVDNLPTPAVGEAAVNLFYKTTFEANASQELSVTVLGETTTPTTPDEVIVQYVDLGDLNGVMSYVGQWAAGQGPLGGAGTQPIPDITVDFTALLTAAAGAGEMDALFRKKFDAGDSGCGTDDSKPLMRDYSGDASLWPMQTYFTNASFVYSAASTPNGLAAAALNSIPAEAVSKVEVSELECHSLERAVNGLADAIKVKKYVPADSAQQDPSVRQLFEQAAAAGKIDTTAEGTKFVDGDSITLYVNYTMKRTKQFLLDGVDVTGGVAAFKPLGLTTAIADGEQLESEDKQVIVAWQFVGKSEKPPAPAQLPA